VKKYLPGALISPLVTIENWETKQADDTDLADETGAVSPVSDEPLAIYLLLICFPLLYERARHQGTEDGEDRIDYYDQEEA